MLCQTFGLRQIGIRFTLEGDDSEQQKYHEADSYIDKLNLRLDAEYARDFMSRAITCDT